MEAYVVHLLSDILEAVRPFPDYVYASMTDEEVDEFDNDPLNTFGYYCGLQQEQFPPAHLLNSLQLERICNAFCKMMYTWNLDTDIPDHVPLTKKYELLVSTLDIKTDISNNLNTFELCSYDPPTCPMGEYCTCKEFLSDNAFENIDDYMHGE